MSAKLCETIMEPERVIQLSCYYNTGGTAEGGDIIFPLERSFIRSHLLLYPPTPGSAIEESDKRELLEDSSGLLSGKIVAVGEK